MRSAEVVEGGGRDRILAAAMARFAADGFRGATVRAIAADAEVSPALVLHHFGSKDGLRAACDEVVRTTIRVNKENSLSEGAQADALQALRAADASLPMMRYLARALSAGGPEAAQLFDEIVADAEIYVQQAIDVGLMHPTDDLHATVTVLTTWQLGALVLHEHVARHLGADLTGDIAGLAAWMVPAGRLLADGTLTDAGRRMVDDIAAADPGAVRRDEDPHGPADPSPRIDPDDVNDPSDPTSPDPPGAEGR